MPRKAIELPDHITYLAILDEHGRVDTKLMPDLAEDQVRHFHRIMLLSRRFDERLLSLQRQGRIGTSIGNTKPLFTRAHPPEQPPSTPPMSPRATGTIPRLAGAPVAGQPCRQQAG